MNKERKHFFLEPALLAKLREEAERDHITVAAALRRILWSHFNAEKMGDQ